MEESTVYFMINVPYRVGVRMNSKDTDGLILSREYPYVTVEKDRLREFVLANKISINAGTIIQVEEPPIELGSINALTDERAEEIMKGNFFTLKKTLKQFTSEEAILKLINVAKKQNKPEKTLELLRDAWDEVSINPNPLEKVGEKE